MNGRISIMYLVVFLLHVLNTACQRHSLHTRPGSHLDFVAGTFAVKCWATSYFHCPLHWLATLFSHSRCCHPLKICLFFSFWFCGFLNISPHNVSYCLHSHDLRMWSRGISHNSFRHCDILYRINTKRASGLFIFFSSSISAHLVFHVSVGHVCVNQGWGPAVIWTGWGGGHG